MQSVSSSDALSRTARARRDDIVAAAVAVLATEGFPAASVERIAAEAGTGKGVVLYHFGTKERILEEVVRSLYEKGAATMTARILAETDHRARLHAYLRSNLEFIGENAAHVVAVQRIVANTAIVPDTSHDVPGIRDLLARGQEAGAFGDFDPQIAALMIRAVVDAASFHLTGNDDVDLDHAVEQVVVLFDRATARPSP